MKLSLVFLMTLFLILGTVACSGSPAALQESQGSVDGNPALSRVALEVPTMF